MNDADNAIEGEQFVHPTPATKKETSRRELPDGTIEYHYDDGTMMTDVSVLYQRRRREEEKRLRQERKIRGARAKGHLVAAIALIDVEAYDEAAQEIGRAIL